MPKQPISSELQSAGLDKFERMILDLLQQDATLTLAAISDKIGLSQTPCQRRIQRLERDGIIKTRVALVDRAKIGLHAHIFAQVKLNAHGRAHLDDFTSAIRRLPEVLECYVLMGTVDFMLKIVARDIEAYEPFFFDILSQLPGIQEINSTVALSEIKSTTALPIPVTRSS